MSRYIDTKYLFECETCSSYRGGKCYTHCDHGESYYPNMTKIPTADVVEVRHGYWKYVDGDLGYSDLECSECGAITAFFDDERFNYCPNCGAKMDCERREQ